MGMGMAASSVQLGMCQDLGMDVMDGASEDNEMMSRL